MAVANEVKLFGKWTFEDVEVGRLRKASGAHSWHVKAIRALYRSSRHHELPRMPSGCEASGSRLHMMEDAKAALELGCSPQYHDVCSH